MHTMLINATKETLCAQLCHVASIGVSPNGAGPNRSVRGWDNNGGCQIISRKRRISLVYVLGEFNDRPFHAQIPSQGTTNGAVFKNTKGLYV